MNAYLGFSKFLFKIVHDVFNIPELEYFRYGTHNLGLMQGHREVDRHSDKKIAGRYFVFTENYLKFSCFVSRLLNENKFAFTLDDLYDSEIKKS